MNLYFIALVPPFALREEIKTLKDEMQVKYNVRHALKSPAHITLQMPFKRPDEDESIIIQTLGQFALKQKSFSVELSGFGCFSNRVIYLNIIDFSYVQKLHVGLNNLLMNQLSFQNKEINIEIHPHITIATRDLDATTFVKAWPHYKNREFKASFEINSLVLLKHNGVFWDIYREFLFTEDLRIQQK